MQTTHQKKINPGWFLPRNFKYHFPLIFHLALCCTKKNSTFNTQNSPLAQRIEIFWFRYKKKRKWWFGRVSIDFENWPHNLSLQTSQFFETKSTKWTFNTTLLSITPRHNNENSRWYKMRTGWNTQKLIKSQTTKTSQNNQQYTNPPFIKKLAPSILALGFLSWEDKPAGSTLELQICPTNWNWCICHATSLAELNTCSSRPRSMHQFQPLE